MQLRLGSIVISNKLTKIGQKKEEEKRVENKRKSRELGRYRDSDTEKVRTLGFGEKHGPTAKTMIRPRNAKPGGTK